MMIRASVFTPVFSSVLAPAFMRYVDLQGCPGTWFRYAFSHAAIARQVSS